MKKSLRVKAYVLIVTLTLLLSAIAVGTSYFLYDNTINTQYKESAVNLARTEAAIVDTDLLNTYGQRVLEIYHAYVGEHGVPDMDSMTEEESAAYFALYSEVYDMEGYMDVRESIRQLAGSNDVLYMYITLWDTDNGTVIYLMDGSVEVELTDVGQVEPIEASNLEKIRGGDYDIPAYITNYPEYGWLCTGTYCVYGSDGNMIAHAYADISMNEVKTKSIHFMINIAVMMLIIILALTPVAIVLFNKVMVDPVKLIAEKAKGFVSDRGKEKQDVFGDLKVKRQDEIGQLYSSMQQMENEINQYIQNITDITAEKERVSAELQIATQIQADMLPNIFPPFPNRKEFDIYATMQPAKEVGGDFYDFFLLDEDHLAMVMADVSGKGVPAALFMVIAKTLIKNRAQYGGTPEEILFDVNNTLCEGNNAQLFVTVWMSILSISTGKGTAVNAGHENPVICHAGGDFELIKYRHSPVVAAMEGMRFRQHEFELQPGDTLFVYTDGVPEATDKDNTMFGEERMLAALNTNKDGSLEQLLDGVRKDVKRFVGEAPQFDDMTMLGFKYYGEKQ